MTNPSEKFGYLTPLQLQLILIGDMLVIASSTSAKIGTSRLDPLGRTTHHFSQFGPVETAPLLDDPGFHLFVINRQRYENDLSSSSGDPCAAERDILNPKPEISFWRTAVSKLALWNINTSPRILLAEA